MTTNTTTTERNTTMTIPRTSYFSPTIAPEAVATAADLEQLAAEVVQYLTTTVTEVLEEQHVPLVARLRAVDALGSALSTIAGIGITEADSPEWMGPLDAAAAADLASLAVEVADHALTEASTALWEVDGPVCGFCAADHDDASCPNEPID